MEKTRILELIKTTPLLVEDGGAEAELRKRITETFVKYGQHRSLAPEAFTDEMSTLSGLMLSDIRDDGRLSTLHTGEISYAFSEGIKGRLFRDDSIGINYKLIMRWLDTYVNSPERQSAYMESSRSSRRIPAHKYTDDEIWQIIRREYAEYCDWKVNGKKIMDGAISGMLGPMPQCYDFGKVFIGFIRRKVDGMDGFSSLRDVFDYWYEQGREL